jgi:hypothetical protein
VRSGADRLISGKPSRLRADGDPEGSPSDPVTTDPKGEVRCPAAQPQIYAPYNTPALIEGMSAYGGTALDPWYVTGLVEGEGCFCISFALRSKLKTGLEVRPSFSLSLNERDRELLVDLQTYFECGQIRVSRGDRTFKYEARALRDHVERIVPHFERYPLRGSKATGFRAFADVCRMVEQGDHLRREGLREIVKLACRSSLGKRRYSESELLRALGEVKG